MDKCMINRGRARFNIIPAVINGLLNGYCFFGMTKKYIDVKPVFASVLFLGLAIPCGYLFALQPVDKINKNASAFYVKQGPGQCGPASFYMVFRYHGDDRRDYWFSKGVKGDLFRMGIDYLPGGAVTGTGDSSLVTIKKNSPVSKWMNGNNRSTGWGELTGAINSLYYVGINRKREKFYSVIESCDRITEPGPNNLNIRKTNFYNRIVSGFLGRNRPVIVHLKRSWPFPGHYIVLIGYASATSTVYYMDPNNNTGGVVKKIPADDFIGSYWYEGDPRLHWGKACWNGRWIGFYRAEPGK